YLFDPEKKPDLPLVSVPLIVASDATLDGYGHLVDEPEQCEIEIVTWPAQGWRPIDEDTGDQGGTTEGTFRCRWNGGVLMGRNEAVNGEYVLGWSTDGQTPSTGPARQADHVVLWHMNYHPDGGQLFFPLDGKPFVVPAALPGDDFKPEDVVAFWCDGTRGVYVHPGIWHEGVFPVEGEQRFLDRQGKVHARVSCDLGEEFGVYLSVPLRC
ncbi:MAG: ureidoglycolate lyase, partial [Gammaproteobacteria bacterium]